jgi:RNA polymerase sigma factor (sigma-70 family)
MSMSTGLRAGADLEAGSDLLVRAKSGDQTAWDELFRTCYPKVIRVVRRRLDSPLRSLYDSTDFASDVMKSLAANFDRLDFPSINSLIAFLAQVAEQKVIDEHRRRHTLKRDVTRERPISGTLGEDSPIAIPSHDPTASQLAQANEVHEHLLDREDQVECEVVKMRQEGYDNQDIAAKTGWHVRRVQRFLKDLRDSLRD